MNDLIGSITALITTVIVAISISFATSLPVQTSETSAFREEHQVRNLWRVHAAKVLQGQATLISELKASNSPQLGLARKVAASTQQLENALQDLEKRPTDAHWNIIRTHLQQYCTNIRKLLIPARVRFASVVELMTVGTHDVRFAQDLALLFPRLPEFRNCAFEPSAHLRFVAPIGWNSLNKFRVNWQSYSPSLRSGIEEARQHWTDQNDSALWLALLGRLQATRSKVDLALNEFIQWRNRGTRPRLLVAIIELCALADEFEQAAGGFASTRLSFNLHWLLVLTRTTGKDLRDANLTTRCRRDPLNMKKTNQH
ncbi:MAG: hypothetical protein AAGD43_35360 [Pseudomonadota bacterium]